MTTATEPTLYEIILADGAWFGIGTAEEIAEWTAEGYIPTGYTTREFAA